MGGEESKPNQEEEVSTNENIKTFDIPVTIDSNMWEFNPKKEDWESYTERLEMYFLAFDVPAEKQSAILLSAVGRKRYGLLKELCAPMKPSEKKYHELVKIVSDHLSSIPKSRYKFNKAKQTPTESMADFVGRLRLLASHCDFDNPDDRICDQLVYGLADDHVRNNLLQHQRLSIAKACKIATEKDHGKNNTQQSGKKEKQFKKKEYRSSLEEFCYCCGKTNHLTRNCRYRFQKDENRGANFQGQDFLKSEPK